MGRPPCCDKSYVKKGAWTEEEDAKILAYVASHGACNWLLVPKIAGLQRCGKSCRLRWINYLRPDLKHESFTPEEEELIISLHAAFGSRWSLMAKKLPGHTDNEIKNYWNTKISKKLIQMRIDPVTHKPFSQLRADCQSMQLKYSTSPSCRNLTDGITCLNRDVKKDCTLNSEYNLPGPYLVTSSILVRPGQTQAMQLAAGSSQASFLGDQSSSSSFFFTNLYDNLHALVAPQLLSSQLVDHHMATPSSSSASSSTSYCRSDQFLLDEPFVPQNQDGPPLAFSSPMPSHDSLSPTSKDITMKHNLMKGDYGGTKNIMVASTSMFEDCSDKSFVDAMLQNHSKMLQQLPYYVFDPID